jgi:hypothetical protein
MAACTSIAKRPDLRIREHSMRGSFETARLGHFDPGDNAAIAYMRNAGAGREAFPQCTAGVRGHFAVISPELPFFATDIEYRDITAEG